MVNVVSAVSAAQNSSLKANVQNSAPATPASAPSSSNTDFVVSEIYVDNLQNVAILEYRSSQTGQVLQQYPNQAQINAFKAAQHLAEQASTKPQAENAAQQTAAVVTSHTHQTDTTHASVPATTGEAASSSGAATAGAGSSGGNTTTSVVA